MNKEIKDFGKSKKVPASVLKWMWENKETLLTLIALIFPKKVQTLSDEPDPGTTPPPPIKDPEDD